MKRFSASTLGLALAACGAAYNIVTPSSPEESFILGETTRLATKLQVKVTGAVTDTRYPTILPDGTPSYAAGWYDRGTCYYYRPWVVKQEPAALTFVAAHEVCHAKEFLHGAKHDACVEGLLR